MPRLLSSGRGTTLLSRPLPSSGCTPREYSYRGCISDCALGGVLLLSTFGPSNLSEIRQLTGQGLDYTPSMQVAHWLDALAPSVRVEEELYPLSFASPREVLLHLKRTGVTATTTASDGFWTASKLRAFEEAYQRLFASPTGGVSLSYHPIYLMAERPRE